MWAAAQGKNSVVALHTELTPELILEGIAKDAIRIIQDLRKKRQCQFTDRIVIEIATEDANLRQAIEAHREFIASETLAIEIILHSSSPLDGAETVDLADVSVAIRITVQPSGR